jgi:hypothetical protein
LSLLSCNKDNDDSDKKINSEVFAASGNIQAELDEFRNVLGTLNTTVGASGGRREINWDGVPEDMLHQALPADFFNPVGSNAPAARQRGLAYAASQNFQVSNSGFASLNADAASQFSAFSGDKVFTNVSSAQWEISFQKPGQSTAGKVKAFGAVFSDVDLDSSTSIEFVDGQESLGKFFVPKKTATENFSFLGVYFPDRKISAVKIAHSGKLGDQTKDVSNGGTDDLIVLDDFIYSEPE